MEITRFKKYFAEMAAPRNIDKDKVYWHGTTSLAKVKTIMSHGLIPYNVSVEGVNNKTKYSSIAIPVEGMVYFAKNPYSASRHAIATPGHKNKTSYLICVSGKNLEDIYPDEDEVGVFVHDCYAIADAPHLFDAKERKVWAYIKRSFGKDKIKEWFEGSKQANLIKIGKEVLSKVSAESSDMSWFYYTIIDRGNNVAHKGNIKATGAYEIRPNANPEDVSAIKALKRLCDDNDRVTESDLLKIKGIKKIA